MNKLAHSFVVIILVTIIISFNLNSDCCAADSDQSSVYHIVICWLKDSNSESDLKTLIQETKKLKSIPGIISIQAGKMLPSERPIVDSTFDIGIIMSFRDQKAMNDYLKNPIHQQATKKILMPLTSKVVVYDFIEY